MLVADPMDSTESQVELLVARVAELELRTTLLEAMRSDPGLPRVVPVEDRLRMSPAVEEAEGSSVELVELVELALYSSGAFDSDSGCIEVVEWGGVGVALQGSVRSRAEQLLAERLAGEVTGIEGVVNELQVRAEAPPR